MSPFLFLNYYFNPFVFPYWLYYAMFYLKVCVSKFPIIFLSVIQNVFLYLYDKEWKDYILIKILYLCWLCWIFQNDSCDSQSSSSLSLRTLKAPSETTGNSQSPPHIKVQRSVSASSKPRRFSHSKSIFFVLDSIVFYNYY